MFLLIQICQFLYREFEILGKNPVFILDGAHNPHGMTAAANSLKALFPDKKIVFVTGAMADKDIAGMYSLIVPIADVFYTTTPENPRSMPKEQLANEIRKLGGKAEYADDFEDAIKKALTKAGAGGVVAALGSLYFSSDIRNAYINAVTDR